MARGGVALNVPVILGTSLLVWTLWAAVAPHPPALPVARQLLAQPQPSEPLVPEASAQNRFDPAAVPARLSSLQATQQPPKLGTEGTPAQRGPGHPTTGPTSTDPKQEQERFCQALPTQGEPPRHLFVPWLPDGSSPAQQPAPRHGLLRGGDSSEALLKLLPAVRSRFLANGHLAVSDPYRMYVHQSGDIVSTSIASEGSWEPEMTSHIVKKLELFALAKGVPREAVVFMDVGANIGAHTLAVAAHGFSVLAFEPLNVNILCLRHSLCLNPDLQSRITLVPQGLGNATQKCTIYSDPDNLGDGVVACGAADNPARYLGLAPRGQLDIVKLDNSMQQDALRHFASRGRIGVVKIDVEGNEGNVLDGGLRFFETVRPPYVTAECSDSMMVRATTKPASAFLRKMSQLGYTVHKSSFDGPVIPPEVLGSWKVPSIENYWFVLDSY